MQGPRGCESKPLEFQYLTSRSPIGCGVGRRERVASRDSGFEMEGCHDVSRCRAPEVFESLGDHRAVPARAVLPIEGDQIASRGDTRGESSGLQQEQRVQRVAAGRREAAGQRYRSGSATESVPLNGIFSFKSVSWSTTMTPSPSGPSNHFHAEKVCLLHHCWLTYAHVLDGVAQPRKSPTLRS